MNVNATEIHKNKKRRRKLKAKGSIFEGENEKTNTIWIWICIHVTWLWIESEEEELRNWNGRRKIMNEWIQKVRFVIKNENEDPFREVRVLGDWFEGMPLVMALV